MKAVGILLIMGAGGFLVYYMWKKQQATSSDPASGSGGINIGQIGSSVGNGVDPTELAAVKNVKDKKTEAKQVAPPTTVSPPPPPAGTLLLKANANSRSANDPTSWRRN